MKARHKPRKGWVGSALAGRLLHTGLVTVVQDQVPDLMEGLPVPGCGLTPQLIDGDVLEKS